MDPKGNRTGNGNGKGTVTGNGESGEFESINFDATQDELNKDGYNEVTQIQVERKIILNKGDIMTYSSSSDGNLTRYIEIRGFLGEKNIDGIVYNQYHKGKWVTGKGFVITPNNSMGRAGTHWIKFNNLK